ncbi:hypothetical protein [Candidatus Nitronereus thalassa]|uniref:Lipoprotein n=1 Tax=Candidatus Nitronereus thalassa TaxID=3020898 RepID=A0ABU3KBR9_9BACT|nr:hypothetical protein [Candidatus Nitronereus thalassa]MDT7043955.1 hypothetical protein [Candidatus Nitronereus thalassa]
MYEFPFPYRILHLCILLAFLSGCYWTPRVETPIFEDSQVSVSLTTVSDESFSADHPVSFHTETMTHILTGLKLEQHKRLLQKLFSSDNSPHPVFTEEQTHVLADQLKQAFSQVTPEEHVAFQTHGNPKQDIQPLKGTMYVKNENLYISLIFANSGAHAATKTAGRTVRTVQEGTGKPTIVFTPQEAIQAEQKPHWLLGGADTNHVVINLRLLASLKDEHSFPSMQADKTTDTAPKASISEKTTPLSQEIETASDQSETNSDTQLLMEEIKALRKELADQKKAIEEIKQEKTETR